MDLDHQIEKDSPKSSVLQTCWKSIIIWLTCGFDVDYDAQLFTLLILRTGLQYFVVFVSMNTPD